MERNRQYIQALLQQHEKIKKEKDSMEEKLNFELSHQREETASAKANFAKVKKEWAAKSELIAEVIYFF